MTREEAFEYLNLPSKSSEQLVRKRYLELHRDYQKAISNAPSEHFRMLYRENLEKIEEAYLLMKQSPVTAAPSPGAPVTHESISDEVQNRLDQAQQLVDRLLDNGSAKLDAEAEAQINQYIEEISQLQHELQQAENPDDSPKITVSKPAVIPPVPPVPIPEHNSDIADNSPNISAETALKPGPSDPETPPPGDHKDHLVEEALEKPLAPPPKVKTRKRNPSKDRQSGRFRLGSDTLRRQSYNRILMGAIFLTLLSATGGLMYTMFPVFFPEDTTNQEVADAEPSESSIQRVVGDEFFRTGNYLEALVQYTLAIAEQPESQYLQQRIDSCKVLLGQITLVPTDQESVEPEAQIDQPVKQPASQTASRPPTNSSNRFRGEEPGEQQAEEGTQWSDDNKVNEQIINSARSAQASDSVQGTPLDSSESNTANVIATPEPGEADEVKNFVDVLPEPLGGYEQFAKFTSRKIRYPSTAYQAKVSGMVIVQFVVRKNGSISNAKVVKGIGHGCDEEALRVVQLYQGWTPGKLNGEIVNTRVAVPIYFKLVE